MFGEFLTPIKVRLNADLSYYFPGLTSGLEGYTMGNAFKSDTYTAVINVYFDGYGVATVVLDRLDIIDEEYLDFLKRREETFLKSLKDAKEIVKKVGPKGGFKELKLFSSFGKITISNKKEADKIERALKELKKEIKIEII